MSALFLLLLLSAPSTTTDASVAISQIDEKLVSVRLEVYHNGRMFDISHKIKSDMPVPRSENGLGQFLCQPANMKNSSLANISVMKLSTHTGTHVDAPGHVFDHYFDAGFDVDTLDLEVLNAEVMQTLQIPKGIRPVLFRTLNTDTQLMFKKQFDTSFVGFTEDGAKWLVENTNIKLVGIDYLSVAAWSCKTPARLVFLESREIIIVEGLKLNDVQTGMFSVHCLPLSLLDAEGSPTRCILIK